MYLFIAVYTDFIFLVGTILFLHSLAVISPGPDFLMVMKNSLGRSRIDGVFTSAGISLGIGVHILYCAAGFAIIISQSIILFTIFKVLAGIYLIWLGISAWKSKNLHAISASANLSDLQKSFKEGFITNVLNPKASLFFLSLFTLVLPSGLALMDVLIIGLLLILNTFIWFVIVSIVATTKQAKSFYSKGSTIIMKFFGSILAFLGINLILSEK